MAGLKRHAHVQPDSRFAAAYAKGIKKTQYWEPIYEDSLNLIAKLPGLAALIYRNEYHGGKQIPPDAQLDWAANLAHMMGARTLHTLNSASRLNPPTRGSAIRLPWSQAHPQLPVALAARVQGGQLPPDAQLDGQPTWRT